MGVGQYILAGHTHFLNLCDLPHHISANASGPKYYNEKSKGKHDDNINNSSLTRFFS